MTYADGSSAWTATPNGLDAAFPYPYGYTPNGSGGFVPCYSDYGWYANGPGYSADNTRQPYSGKDVDNGGDNWTYSNANDTYTTWVMYRPPTVGEEGTIYVPLDVLTWSWGGKATNYGNDIWGVAETPPFSSTQAANTDLFPYWTESIPEPVYVGP